VLRNASRLARATAGNLWKDLRAHDPDLRLGLEHSRGGDLEIVVLCQRRLDQIAESVVLEQLEPLEVPERRLLDGFAGEAERRRARLRPLVVGPDEAAGERECDRDDDETSPGASEATHHDVLAPVVPSTGVADGWPVSAAVVGTDPPFRPAANRAMTT